MSHLGETVEPKLFDEIEGSAIIRKKIKRLDTNPLKDRNGLRKSVFSKRKGLSEKRLTEMRRRVRLDTDHVVQNINLSRGIKQILTKLSSFILINLSLISPSGKYVRLYMHIQKCNYAYILHLCLHLFRQSEIYFRDFPYELNISDITSIWLF